ncbi:MAG: class I SAM-dependent methyltransferase [Deltaproteobacteria bacterium]|nr:class I SAM-dependent methyltransferase [Deltaproteobacteria bacterium]
MLWKGTRKSKNGTAKVEIFAYGIYALYARHKVIRDLKSLHSPVYHGFRIWPSSWLLMDFLEHRGLPQSSQVLDVGCGWGLGGIYCAKNYHASVTAVDIDSEVFPYLKLHAKINHVKINVMEKRLEQITVNQLKPFNILIGADICFWDTLVEPLIGLINRSLEAGVHSVFITDPGRPTFKMLAEHFIKNEYGEVWDWAVKVPQKFNGQILKIALPHTHLVGQS